MLVNAFTTNASNNNSSINAFIYYYSFELVCVYFNSSYCTCVSMKAFHNMQECFKDKYVF